jgi:PRTRC genetic system protein E
MEMFKKFAALVEAGMVFTIKIQKSAGENGQMRLDILPETAAGVKGVVIPARALVATPEELDQEIPGFLETYLASTADLRDQIAVTQTVMDQAAKDAQDAAKAAAGKKADTKKASSVKVVAGSKSKPAKADGMMDDDEDDGGDQDDNADEGEDPPSGTSSGGAKDIGDLFI